MNPTIRHTSQTAAVFSSGMAAICTTLINFLGQGDRIVTTRNLYGGTVGVLDQDFVRFGSHHMIGVQTIQTYPIILLLQELLM